MIKIEIDVATGAEARLELLNLLGLPTLPFSATINGEDLQIALDRTKKAVEEISSQITDQLVEEPVKTKRRTKAEIEADKKATEVDTSQAPEGSVDTDQSKENIETGTILPTLQDLQRICAILVRAGYKQQGIDFIKNVGSADTSKDVAEDKRQACIDVMTKFAEENKIAM